MTTTQPSAPNDPGEDVQSYLRHNLMLVQTGRRNRAPGIRRCTDCHTLMLITPDGDRLCDCCREQTALFPTGIGGRS